MTCAYVKRGLVHPRRPARARVSSASRKDTLMADRRAGPKQGPYVRDKHGGLEPRDRNKDGTWRKKRSDAGKPRKSKS